MSLSSRKKLILLKLETTYGDDSTPGAVDAVLVSAVEITPLASDTVDRELIKPSMGASALMHVGEHITLGFSIENQSSGAAGVPPAFSAALQAACMQETIDLTGGSENVSYTPKSENFKSATIFFYEDTVLHKVVGCRGTFGLGYEPKGLTRLAFKFTGLYAGPVTGTLPTPDWAAFKDPLAVGAANSSDFELHGFAAIASALTLEAGYEVAYHPTLTTEEIRVANRKSSGSLTIDAPPLASIDFIERVRTNQVGNLTLQHGQTPGSIVVFSAPAAQLLAPKYGDATGTTTLEMGFNLLPTAAGDDDFTLVYR